MNLLSTSVIVNAVLRPGATVDFNFSFRYRYNFEFVPHPKMSHKKSGRYFVKYRRNAYIRQYVSSLIVVHIVHSYSWTSHGLAILLLTRYFCEIRKNHEEDDAALVFKVERIP